VDMAEIFLGISMARIREKRENQKISIFASI
jgi:hypothetical protein